MSYLFGHLMLLVADQFGMVEYLLLFLWAGAVKKSNTHPTFCATKDIKSRAPQNSSTVHFEHLFIYK